MAINRSGASTELQTQLQNEILKVYPEGLPKFGADGDFGREGQAAFKRIMDSSPEEFKDILDKMGVEADADLTVEQAIEAVKTFGEANPDFKVSPTTTLNIGGAHEIEERQIQTLLNIIEPDSAKVDGSFSKDDQAALQTVLDQYAEILTEKGIEVGGKMDAHDVIAALNVIAEQADRAAGVSDGSLSKADTSKEDVRRIQSLIRVLDPDAMSKGQIDGLYGPQTEKALTEALEGSGLDIATASTQQIVAALEKSVIDLPERYVVEDCDNLTQIAREVYGDEIKEYTQQLLELEDSKFPTEKAARVHAEQVAVARIAFANDLGDGTDAHYINRGDILQIPDAGPLKASDPSLDWDALDGEVGPGGPCGCDGESPIAPSPHGITTHFTPVSYSTPNYSTPGLPQTITDGECVAVYQGEDRKGRPMYKQEGPSGNAHDEVREVFAKFNITDGRSLGSCGPTGGGESDQKNDAGLGPGEGPGGTTGLGKGDAGLGNNNGPGGTSSLGG